MNDKNIGNQSTQQEVNTFKATADKTAAHCLHFTYAFIQSDLQCIQAIHYLFYYFLSVCVCSLGIEPMTFCTANTMLYHWATGTLLIINSYSVNNK